MVSQTCGPCDRAITPHIWDMQMSFRKPCPPLGRILAQCRSLPLSQAPSAPSTPRLPGPAQPSPAQRCILLFLLLPTGLPAGRNIRIGLYCRISQRVSMHCPVLPEIPAAREESMCRESRPNGTTILPLSTCCLLLPSHHPIWKEEKIRETARGPGRENSRDFYLISTHYRVGLGQALGSNGQGSTVRNEP